MGPHPGAAGHGQRVARYDDSARARLLNDSGIVRNRLKIDAAISNAQAFLAIAEEVGSSDRYIWQFVDGTPIQNH